MHAYSNTRILNPDPRFTNLFQYLQVHSSNVSSNRIKIQEILLILQLETDYFSKLFISEMHSKQWHYSLHRDFQNCYSTRRKSYKNSSAPIPAPIPAPMLHVHITLQSREFSIQNPILHTEDKELFEYYYYYYRGQRDLHSRFQKFYA